MADKDPLVLLSRKVKLKLKERNKIARNAYGDRLGYKLWMWGNIHFCIFLGTAGVASLVKIGDISRGISFLLMSLGMFFQSRIWASLRKTPPSSKKEFDLWVRKDYKKQVLYWGVFYLLLAIANSLSKDTFGNFQMLGVLSYTSFVVFIGCVFGVVINPKLFISGFVGGVGTVTYYIFTFLMPVRVAIEVLVPFSRVIQIPQSFTYLFILLLIVLFVPILNKLKDKGLNKVQSYSLLAVSPDRLIAAIRPYEKLLKDKYQALSVKLNLDSELSYGVKEELIKLYAEENKSKTEKFWIVTFLVAIVTFVVTSLGQSFLEDVLYNPFIKPLLCSFSQSCK